MKFKFNADREILKILNNKKFLITGGKGMLGNSFLKQIKLYVKNPRIYLYSKKDLDISNKKSFKKINKIKPDFIIHCAALVNADLCEKKPSLAKKNILIATKNIINFAKKNNSKIFFPQSFLIYKNSNKIVNENTKPSPLSVYGRYKLLSEKILLKSYPNSLIVRMGGFFGGFDIDTNFVGKITKHISKLIKLNIKEITIGDRVWQPSYVDDLTYNSLILIAHDKFGLYNMASLGSCSFFDLTKKIVKYLKLSKKINVKKTSAKLVGKRELAKRPLSLIMENKRLKIENLDRQRKWENSLKEYLSNKYFKNLLK